MSHTLTAPQEAALIDEQRRPVVPELFWELTSRWRPIEADLRTMPRPGDGSVNDALKLGLDDVCGDERLDR